MDIEKLIENEKACCGDIETEDCSKYCIDPRDSRDSGLRWCRQWLIHDLHTALSTLQAKNEKLRSEVERQRRSADDRKHLYENAERAYMKVVAELEQAKRERDAIEQDFRAFAKQWWEQDSGFPCRWCKFENSGGCEWKAKQPNEEKICAGRAFEWRGQKKD